MKQIYWAIAITIAFMGTARAQFTDTSGRSVIGTWLMTTSDPKGGYGPEVGFCVNRFAGPGIMLNPQKPNGIGFLSGDSMGDPDTCKMGPKSKASCINPKNKDRWECTISPQAVASCVVYGADGKIKLKASGPRYPGEC